MSFVQDISEEIKKALELDFAEIGHEEERAEVVVSQIVKNSMMDIFSSSDITLDTTLYNGTPTCSSYSSLNSLETDRNNEQKGSITLTPMRKINSAYF